MMDLQLAGKSVLITGSTSGNVPDSPLEDPQQRLRNTRWAPDPANEDMYYGISTHYLKDLVGYWLHDFDWRQAEAQIDAYTQYKVEIDGQPVHFIWEQGKGPHPIPLIMSHGWPSTFWDYNKVIKPLADPAAFGGDPADAFDVFVPSLAGFGFSTPASDDMNHWKMADILNTLMTESRARRAAGASSGSEGRLHSTATEMSTDTTPSGKE
jgi:microsomal epoxide hydrolase